MVASYLKQTKLLETFKTSPFSNDSHICQIAEVVFGGAQYVILQMKNYLYAP